MVHKFRACYPASGRSPLITARAGPGRSRALLAATLRSVIPNVREDRSHDQAVALYLSRQNVEVWMVRIEIRIDPGG
jgi:hypothetical protein